METISIFLADPQVLFREGIHFTISEDDDIEVIGEAACNNEVFKFIRDNPPNIAILNANQGFPNGIDITSYIKRNTPTVSIILIIDDNDEEQLLSAIKAGASAYITKYITPDDLLTTIRRVANGVCPISETLFKPGIALRIINKFEFFWLINLFNEEMNNLLLHLSHLESNLLNYIAEGISAEQVSQVLRIDEKTIKRHLNVILTKIMINERICEVIEIIQLRSKPTISNINDNETNSSHNQTRL
ncbi:MAG: response regulator transcription factor [Dehalococcoidales bacterium]|nr:response regulator transcription factor [Dehalococcoidales bacterium]